jgi:hypothetical protein
VLEAPASNMMVFFLELHVFLLLSRLGLFGTKWAFLNVQKYDFLKFSFQEFKQFSQGNNVVDATAFKTNGIILRNVCVSLTQL